MDSRALGLLIVGLGLAAVVVGFLVMYGGLSWFGHLPGDIHIERGGVQVYVPVTSMILVSLVLTVASWVVRRFL